MSWRIIRFKKYCPSSSKLVFSQRRLAGFNNDVIFLMSMEFLLIFKVQRAAPVRIGRCTAYNL